MGDPLGSGASHMYLGGTPCHCSGFSGYRFQAHTKLPRFSTNLFFAISLLNDAVFSRDDSLLLSSLSYDSKFSALPADHDLYLFSAAGVATEDTFSSRPPRASMWPGLIISSV